MKAKNNELKNVENKIIEEFREEMRNLKKEGKVYKFEEAMDHAIEKFVECLKDSSKEEIEKYSSEDNKKKLS